MIDWTPRKNFAPHDSNGTPIIRQCPDCQSEHVLARSVFKDTKPRRRLIENRCLQCGWQNPALEKVTM